MKKLLILTCVISITFSCTNAPIISTGPQNTLPAEFSALFNIFDGQGIGAATNINDDIMLFFSTDGTEYAWFEDNEIKKVASVDEENGLFDGMAFNNIGAIIDYEEEKLVAFNSSGGNYQWISLDPLAVPGASADNDLFTFGSVYSLTDWGIDFSCPFEKVGAMFGFSKEAEGCTITEDDDLYMWMVNEDTDEIVRFIKESPGTFEEDLEIDVWRSNSICGGSPAIFPLAGIGAACVYDPDAGIYQELFFSPDGTEMVILTPSTGKFSEVHKLK